MPMEPYWEVMSYWEAKQKGLESSTFFVSNVSQFAATIVDAVKLLDVKRVISSLSPHIKEYIDTNARIAAALKSDDLEGNVNYILGTLQIDYDNMMTLLSGGLGDGVGSMYSTLYETLNGTNARLQSFIGLTQRIGIDPFISRWINSAVKPNIPDAATAWRMYRIGLLTYDNLKELAHQNGWSDEWLDKLNYVFQTPLPIGIMFDLYRRGLMTLEDFKWQLNQSRFDEHRIDGIINLAVQIPEPYRIADFAAKELIDNAQAEGAFKWFGMDARWAGIWKESQRAFPQLGVLNELLWRKLISEEDWNYALRRQGYIEKWPEMMHGLLEAIPPSQDLVTMVVREAWEPENVTPAPDIFAKYMSMRGFSKDWSDRYWTAHWLPMPLQYAYDNLRRGYWTKEKFMDLLRIADLHPRWREDIYNVAFNPPSIREMGYGYDVGVYSIDDIVKYRRWGGLSEEDAKKSGQAMVAYRTEAEREAVRRDYLRLYVNGNMSREDFETALIAIGTVPEGVPLWLERGDLEIELKSTETSITEPKNITRSDAQWLFENGLRDEAWFRETLKNLGYLDASIDAYADQSKKRIQDKIKPPKVTVKELSIADLRVAYRNDVISEATLRAELSRRKYSDEDIDVIVAIEMMRKPTPPVEKIREVTAAQLSMLFRKGIIAEDEYRSELASRKYSAVDIDRIVELDKTKMIVPAPEVKYKELTLSQIQNLIKLGLYNKDEAVAAIQALDYTEKDASLIVQIMAANAFPEPEIRELSDAQISALYDYDLVSEVDILDHFKARGYSETDARLLTQLTVINSNLPDLKAMYSKGWINQNALFEGIKALGIPMEYVEPSLQPKVAKLIEVVGLPDEKAKRLMLTIVKAEQPTRTQSEKDLTKAEIVKGVKVGVVTPQEGVSLLQGLGYDENEAWYILAINKVVSAGDPEGYWDMRRVVEAAKKARGEASVQIPDELVALEKQRKAILAQLDKLKASKAAEEEIGRVAVQLAGIESRMRTIVAKLKLA